MYYPTEVGRHACEVRHAGMRSPAQPHIAFGYRDSCFHPTEESQANLEDSPSDLEPLITKASSYTLLYKFKPSSNALGSRSATSVLIESYYYKINHTHPIACVLSLRLSVSSWVDRLLSRLRLQATRISVVSLDLDQEKIVLYKPVC
jgi:hypothetical protein